MLRQTILARVVADQKQVADHGYRQQNERDEKGHGPHRAPQNLAPAAIGTACGGGWEQRTSDVMRRKERVRECGIHGQAQGRRTRAARDRNLEGKACLGRPLRPATPGAHGADHGRFGNRWPVDGRTGRPAGTSSTGRHLKIHRRVKGMVKGLPEVRWK